MPSISILMIRTALLYLGVGFTLGALALANKGLVLLPWLWSLRMAHVHLLLAGWMVQLACGVAFWILPRYDASGDRGAMLPVLAGYLALNIGVCCGALRDPLLALGITTPVAWLALLSGAGYTLAVLLLVPALWRRVLPFRNLPRSK